MREVLLIARREYLERVRSRAFLMMTILFPIFIGLLVGGSIVAGKFAFRREADRDRVKRCGAGACGCGGDAVGTFDPAEF